MCGISGLARIDPAAPVEREIVARMNGALVHRGPDGEGTHLGQGIGLGVRRLAIVDLETGDQPIVNEDGTVVVVCNGEIYNHVELRRELEAAGHRFRTRSDVEPIVHLYEDLGLDFVERLRGMFALAVWDARRRRLVLARDRTGIKPLVYAETPEGLAFASEAKAILAAGLVEPRLDPAGVGSLFTWGFVRTPATMFEGILRLPPGCRLVYRNGRARVDRYWRISFPGRDRPRRSDAAWIEGLGERLRESVRLHLRSDVPVGVWLSGGLDSSAVSSLASGFAAHLVPALSLEFEDPRLDEVGGVSTLADGSDAFAERRVRCRAADFARYPFAIWHAEEPTTTGIEIPRHVLARETSRDVKVVLAGEGADEVLGGYWWFRLQKLFAPWSRLPRKVRRGLVRGPVSARWPWAARLFAGPGELGEERYRAMIAPLRSIGPHEVLSPDLLRRAREPGPSLVEGTLGAGSGRSFERLQALELAIRLPDFVTHKLDRTSMAHGVEVRVPFLDPEIVEYCAAMPPRLKMRGMTEKYALREAMRGTLPEAIRTRPKRGLAAPYREWLRGSPPPFVDELLAGRAVADKGYFLPRMIERLRGEHDRGADHGDLLMGALAVQLWDEVFVQGRSPGAWER